MTRDRMAPQPLLGLASSLTCYRYVRIAKFNGQTSAEFLPSRGVHLWHPAITYGGKYKRLTWSSFQRIGF